MAGRIRGGRGLSLGAEQGQNPDKLKPMGAYPILRRFTPEEYLALERASETRNEYVDGLIYAMAGGTYKHDRLSVKLMMMLQNQFGDGNCNVCSANFRIAVSKRGPFFYPDLSVICGEPEFLDESMDCALNPSAVIEVLSKSTRKYDRETKVAHYCKIPSLRHVVLISQFTVSVEHHFRARGGKWKEEKVEDRGVVQLAAIRAALPLSGIYENLS
jgi:Uma2 family endonuclease